jgi:hypothetical protein
MPTRTHRIFTTGKGMVTRNVNQSLTFSETLEQGNRAVNYPSTQIVANTNVELKERSLESEREELVES